MSATTGEGADGMSMTPGQVLWEAWESHYGTGARRWNDVEQCVKDRHESCAQAVIAHVSPQDALSRLVDAPGAQTPTVTPKPDDAVTGLSEAQRDIAHECDTVRDMLLDKNRKYGNSALDPVRMFSRADPVEQIKVRIDDKLSRLASLQADDEDVVLDLIGYLILLRIAQRGVQHD